MRFDSAMAGIDMLSQVVALLAEKIPDGTRNKLVLAKALQEMLDTRDERGRARCGRLRDRIHGHTVCAQRHLGSNPGIGQVGQVHCEHVH